MAGVRLKELLSSHRGALLFVVATALIAAFSATACGKSPSAAPSTPTKAPTTIGTASPSTTSPTPVSTPPFPSPTPALAAGRTPFPLGAGTPIPPATLPLIQSPLPRDEGSHNAPIEWWYFNGHLADASGKEYSFHYVTFQRPTDSGLATQVMHASFGDSTKQAYYLGEKLALGTTSPLPGSFLFQAEGWRMAGDGLDYVLAFDLRDVSLLLRAGSRKPPVLHQETGLVSLGPAGQSYYYSRTRLEALGTVTFGREPVEVRGTLWMDHQWGSFNTSPVGWDWVALQLGDGSELMVSAVWGVINHRPLVSYGTYVAADGSVKHLAGHEVAFTPTGVWTSPSNETVYPMGWQLGVLPLSLVVAVTPVQQNAEFNASTYIPVPYWEGAVKVQGTRGGVAIAGKGFVEMVGYAARKAGPGATVGTQGR